MEKPVAENVRVFHTMEVVEYMEQIGAWSKKDGYCFLKLLGAHSPVIIKVRREYQGLEKDVMDKFVEEFSDVGEYAWFSV